MKRYIGTTVAFGLVTASVPALADQLVVQPVQISDEAIRYQHGVPTTDVYSQSGSVQVRPEPLDHGGLAFDVAVFNLSNTPANVDVPNFTLSADTQIARAQSVQELQKKAKRRAGWAQFAVALAGGLSAAAAASQRDYYHSTVYTPHGVYHSTFSAPSEAGQIQATAIAAGTGVGVAAIQHRLDDTLNGLGDQVVQLTTVDPGQSYGGRIVFEKLKLATLPARVALNIDWNGTKYVLTFQVAKAGTPAPTFKPVTAEPAAADVPAEAPPAAAVAPAASPSSGAPDHRL